MDKTGIPHGSRDSSGGSCLRFVAGLVALLVATFTGACGEAGDNSPVTEAGLVGLQLGARGHGGTDRRSQRDATCLGGGCRRGPKQGHGAPDPRPGGDKRAEHGCDNGSYRACHGAPCSDDAGGAGSGASDAATPPADATGDGSDDAGANGSPPPTQDTGDAGDSSDGTRGAEGDADASGGGASEGDQPVILSHASCWGDPHFVTFDRLAYDHQGVGEYILSRSNDRNFEVQVRTRPWGNSRLVAVASAVAVRVMGDRVGFYLGRDPLVHVNGEATSWPGGEIDLPGGGRVALTGSTYRVQWDDGSYVDVVDRGSHLNVTLGLSEVRQAGVAGLLGDSDGDLAGELRSRDGATFEPPLSFDQMYRQYGESWRVMQAESLFDYDVSETTETFTDRTFPHRSVSVEDYDADDRAQALQICDQAGASDPILQTACALDLLATADTSFVAGSTEAREPQALASVDGVGHSENHPATSCLHVQQAGADNGDGTYFVETSAGALEMYCAFGASGGGWTRVARLDTTSAFCGNEQLPDLRLDPEVSMAKIPDADVQALMLNTNGSPHELMYMAAEDGRHLWHQLENVTDYDTSSRHASSSYYCGQWHCDDGGTDASACGSEGSGCPVTAHGISGLTKKIYVDSAFSRHIRGMHINGNLCGMPNYERSGVWIFVR